MQRILKNLNNVETELLVWGDPFSDDNQETIICITGNPGVPEFYIDFASELNKKLNKFVCVIGHAGHINIANDKSNNLVNQELSFGLKAQIKHKLDLLENHIPGNSKIHLIGHSIGAWIILELLQDNDKLRERISSINLLFPTLQRMAETRNGIFLNNILRNIYWLILILCQLLYLIPTFAFRYLIHSYLKFKSLPYSYYDAILNLVSPLVLNNILIMAFNEMDTVRDINSSSLQKVKHLTNVIYSNIDGWAPLEYMEDLKMYEPHLQMKEAHNIEHAFVLKSSKHIAEIVASFIQSKTT